jgi:Fe-S-cluster-containing hydrogenase component 2/bacterioferritin-associated ferredoxin
MAVYAAGDALEIAEASAAIFSGRIAGREIAKAFGKNVEVPDQWRRRWETLKSRPGRTHGMEVVAAVSGLFPVVRCVEEIPCDPCIHVCPRNMIKMKGDPIFGVPQVVKDECTGCTLCVAACPGLAITLVDLRGEGPEGLVTVPFELLEVNAGVGDQVDAVDMDGTVVARATVEKIARRKAYDRTLLVTLRVPREQAAQVAGFRVQDPRLSEPVAFPRDREASLEDDAIICRCERVRAGEIRQLIRQGARDLNQLKILRCGMGSCGGKTCQALIQKVFRDEGVDPGDVVPFTQRPLVAEVSLGVVAGEIPERRI